MVNRTCCTCVRVPLQLSNKVTWEWKIRDLVEFKDLTMTNMRRWVQNGVQQKKKADTTTTANAWVYLEPEL